ncbi:hypothetical protein CHCC20331_3044 [Bacillus paralicheniformis]|nr:hypothetical protein SC10_B2orf02656 [Bacillus paralicheniformis]TWK87683.1 hypothetical protein CHCC20331_3044 [Bacillus paralicheniformis]TWN85446.1 hypothetical protein CHCC20492_0705 [Bacillus paralicheniformis]
MSFVSLNGSFLACPVLSYVEKRVIFPNKNKQIKVFLSALLT